MTDAVRVREILKRWEQCENVPEQSDIQTLLALDTGSDGFYTLLAASNRRSRDTFGSRGFVFAQIGLNAEPCSKNCAFCSMADSHYSMDTRWRKDTGQVRQEITRLLEQGIDDLFLMTTADFPPPGSSRVHAGRESNAPARGTPCRQYRRH